MSEEDRHAAVDYISENPQAGGMVEGTAGARKVRVPRAGGGKSGGYRVVTYYMNDLSPIFMLSVISKGKQANLNPRQKKGVKNAAKGEKNERRAK